MKDRENEKMITYVSSYNSCVMGGLQISYKWSHRSQVKTSNHEIMIETCLLSLEDQSLLGYTEIQAKF